MCICINPLKTFGNCRIQKKIKNEEIKYWYKQFYNRKIIDEY